MFRMGVQLPAAWQSVPPQVPLTGTTAPPLAQSVSSALPQTTGVVAYPMQQFRVSPQVKRGDFPIFLNCLNYYHNFN